MSAASAATTATVGRPRRPSGNDPQQAATTKARIGSIGSRYRVNGAPPTATYPTRVATTSRQCRVSRRPMTTLPASRPPGGSASECPSSTPSSTGRASVVPAIRAAGR
ncbi:hypothetical protein, partial [Frankia sp. CcWB2]